VVVADDAAVGIASMDDLSPRQTVTRLSFASMPMIETAAAAFGQHWVENTSYYPRPRMDLFHDIDIDSSLSHLEH
jgi:hypothetical protein